MIYLALTRQEALLVARILQPRNMLPPRWNDDEMYRAGMVGDRLATLIHLDRREFFLEEPDQE